MLQTELMLALRTDVGVNTAAIAARFPRDGLGAAAAAACADAARELPAAWVEFEAAEAEPDATTATGGNAPGENATGENATGENVAGENVAGENVAGERATASEALKGGARRLRLSDPEGLLFSNDAISTVFARLEERLEATARRDARAAKKSTKKGEQWA